MNSKRRKERNHFVKETYTDRVMLHDAQVNFDSNDDYDDDDDEEWSDHSVEDAILSSLGGLGLGLGWDVCMGVAEDAR